MNVNCGGAMPAAAVAAAGGTAAAAADPVALDKGIPNPIHLTRGRDCLLFGTYDPAAGDTVSVAVMRVNVGGTPAQIITDSLATLYPARKMWFVTLPHGLWAREGDTRPINLRLILRKAGASVWPKTFGTLILCGPG